MPGRIFIESLGRGPALAPQVGELMASLVPARRLARGEQVAATAHELRQDGSSRAVVASSTEPARALGGLVEGRPFT